MGNTPSRDSYNPPLLHRASLQDEFLAINAPPATQQPPQHRWAPSSQYANLQVPHHSTTSMLDPAKSRNPTKSEAQILIRKKRRPSLQGKSRIIHSTRQNDDCNAALVTNPNPQSSVLPDPRQQASPSKVVHKLVDPKCVFTRYHQEHERKDCKAAAAEVEAGREAAERSSKATVQELETWDQTLVPIKSTSCRGACSISACEKSQKAGEGKGTKLVLSAAGSLQTTISSQANLDAEVDVASEMKAMMERMGELKTKDPSMFSRLWEDMKKVGAATTAPMGSNSSLSPHVAYPEVSPERLADTALATSALKASATQIIQSSGGPTQLSEDEVIADHNEEELLDLGRCSADSLSGRIHEKKDADHSNKREGASYFVLRGSTLTQPVTSGPQPVSPSFPDRTPRGNAIWPKEKRDMLVDAALTVLNTEPANHEKGISVQNMHDMFEQNPSYNALCRMLEDCGLRFHRGQFARQLLTHVPELARPLTKSGAEPPQDRVRPALARSMAVRCSTDGAQPLLSGSNPGSVKAQLGPFGALPISRFSIQTRHGHPRYSLNTTKLASTPTPQAASMSVGLPSPTVPPLIPGSKTALSRKRDFSEFVDLTQVSDNEDYVIPPKQLRFEQLSAQPEVLDVGTGTSSHGSVSVGQSTQHCSASGRSEQHNPHRPQQAYAPRIEAARRRRAILARPINKSEALHKSYYDPKTVARDILVAAGRHPSERSLNAHYSGLLHRHVALDSDLSTFEWDAFDPGGSPIPREEMVDTPARSPLWKLSIKHRGQGHADANQPMREQPTCHANPTPAITSIARLSAQTNNLMRDADEVTNTAGPDPFALYQSQLVDQDFHDDVGRNVPYQNSNTGHKQSPTLSRTNSRDSCSRRDLKLVESEGNMEKPIGKRRGRPPGSKNKRSSLSVMKKAASASLLVSTPSRPRSPSPAHFDVYECQWRKCNAKLHNLPTLRKHISKVHQPSTEEAIKWGHTCWWKKCKTLVRNEDKTVTPKERFQSQAEWMDHIDESHLHALGMEKGDGPSTSHIGKPQTNPFDLKKYLHDPHDNICDSPTRTASYADPQSLAADRATYLSDKRGRNVTAARTEATNDEYAPDALILAPASNDAEERARIRQYMKAHGNGKMDLKTSASEVLRAMEATKERVGPGMDRGGCTLVNKERRATLLQNEGISRVIMEDD